MSQSVHMSPPGSSPGSAHLLPPWATRAPLCWCRAHPSSAGSANPTMQPLASGWGLPRAPGSCSGGDANSRLLLEGRCWDTPVGSKCELIAGKDSLATPCLQPGHAPLTTKDPSSPASPLLLCQGTCPSLSLVSFLAKPLGAPASWPGIQAVSSKSQKSCHRWGGR